MEEAKAFRAEAYSYKDKRILRMLEDGVPKSEIKSALRTSDHYIAKVQARTEVTT